MVEIWVSNIQKHSSSLEQRIKGLYFETFFISFSFMIKRTVEQKIIRHISFLDAGRVFSSVDFLDVAQPETIRTAFRRLKLAKEIVPLGHSLYYRPICTYKNPYGKESEDHHVERAIARRFGWKVYPSMRECLHALGLPYGAAKIDLLSSGPTRIFDFNSRYFYSYASFKHIPLKEQIFDKLSFMYLQAIKELGANSEEIKNLISRTSEHDLSRISRYIKFGKAKTLITKAHKEKEENLPLNPIAERINILSDS